jgi:hypothetical protein
MQTTLCFLSLELFLPPALANIVKESTCKQREEILIPVSLF